MSIVEKLTEGIINRDLSREGDALISKWEKTGLLEGLESEQIRNGMACLLENQAKELLRESSSMAAGDVEGFAAVAFPLVRRVFGNLIANDLVSVQPMSLPSGLIFFLDFTVSQEIGADATALGRLGYPPGSSFFGGGVVGSQITGGVNLNDANAGRGPYGLNNGYASPTGSNVIADDDWGRVLAQGTVGDSSVSSADDSKTLDALLQFDADLMALSGTATAVVLEVPLARITGGSSTQEFDLDDLVSIQCSSSTIAAGLNIVGEEAGTNLVRRLTTFSSGSQGGALGDRSNANIVMAVVAYDGGRTAAQLSTSCGVAQTMSYVQTDQFNNVGTRAIGAIVGANEWGLEGSQFIPEIDIKIDSVAVTAITKKLKAKWTPELGQDLNAYHNLDAEVELTQILSEQVALEIDREILEDLLQGATTHRFWSRAPGKFLNRETGVEVGASTVAPDFTGNVSEWYETLIETINDVSAQIHRKTLRGGANFVVCGPEVANILEFTAGFRANVTVDSERGSAGAVKVGSLSKKWDIYVDPYFLRNTVLVGRKGGSFLESGYVYAPYVPLQTTPTIFGVEDFVPRKGVMTRYAKKMVRPDMYGLVLISDMMVG